MRLLVIAGIVGLAISTPITTTNSVLPGTSIKLSESEPWKITNFAAFQATDEAKANNNCTSFVTFHFEDVNTGLALNSSCTRTVAGDSNETLADSSYHDCDSDYVNFIYDGEKLQIEHLYTDPGLGSPPYDGAIAFGHSSFNVTKTKVQDGILMTQTEMYIPITSLSG